MLGKILLKFPNDTDIADAVNEVIKDSNGQFRIAEKNSNGWIINQWLRKLFLYHSE